MIDEQKWQLQNNPQFLNNVFTCDERVGFWKIRYNTGEILELILVNTFFYPQITWKRLPTLPTPQLSLIKYTILATSANKITYLNTYQ